MNCLPVLADLPPQELLGVSVAVRDARAAPRAEVEGRRGLLRAAEHLVECAAGQHRVHADCIGLRLVKHICEKKGVTDRTLFTNL